ncbi:MAG: hypothetical protein KF903_11100 [Dokdonella sp.]|nr:hypothetical protein [Dokdonella sp.]
MIVAPGRRSARIEHPRQAPDRPIAKALDLSLDALFGEAAKKIGKRGPAPKLHAQIERIAALPRSKQRMLLDMLDAALNSANAQAA